MLIPKFVKKVCFFNFLITFFQTQGLPHNLLFSFTSCICFNALIFFTPHCTSFISLDKNVSMIHFRQSWSLAKGGKFADSKFVKRYFRNSCLFISNTLSERCVYRLHYFVILFVLYQSILCYKFYQYQLILRFFALNG